MVSTFPEAVDAEARREFSRLTTRLPLTCNLKDFLKRTQQQSSILLELLSSLL
jgi:hypothetical protein